MPAMLKLSYSDTLPTLLPCSMISSPSRSVASAAPYCATTSVAQPWSTLPRDAKRIVLGRVRRAEEGVVDVPFDKDAVAVGRVHARRVERHLEPRLAVAGVFHWCDVKRFCHLAWVRGDPSEFCTVTA